VMELVLLPAQIPFGGDRPRALKEACQQFEAFFLQKLLEAMDRTVERSGLWHRRRAEEFYRGMWYQALALEMAQVGGLGLGEKLLEELQGRTKVFEEVADKIRNLGEARSIQGREGLKR